MRRIPVLFLCGLLAAAPGCYFEQPKPVNPNVAPVRGTVTLNGRPLYRADVTFESLDSRASNAITDEKGQYELTYDEFTKGAYIGGHTVRITMFRYPRDPNPPRPLPERYNLKSTLTVRVQPGENVFNFDLTDDDSE